MDGGGDSNSDSQDEAGIFPVKLITSEGRGRDYVASRDIASNELVLRVAPVSPSLEHMRVSIA